VLQGIAQITASATYTITVGTGGATGSTTSYPGSSGSAGVNSTISGTGVSVTAIGGGGGGASGINGVIGGSGGGGGAAGTGSVPGSGTTGQGFIGGYGADGVSRFTTAGAGGGYGMIGGNSGTSTADTSGGKGGDGFTTYIANPSTYSWSNNFNGTSSYLTYPSSPISFTSTGTWTVECWIYLKANVGTGNFLPILQNGQPTGGNASWGIMLNASNQVYTYWYNGSTAPSAYTTTALSVGQWYHIAVMSNSGTLTTYINGVSQTLNGTTSVGTPTSTVYSYETGAYNSVYLNAYISNLRCTNTVVYTSNFTPSTTPLTAISGTTLLTCQSPTFVDNSTNNYTITNIGGTYIASQNPFGASYAGGGGGGTDRATSGYPGNVGYPGMGGGGTGSADAILGSAGVANTGGGGGGAGGTTNPSGFAGGSGIVILAYPSTYPTAASTTGSPTVTTTGGYRVYTFTGGGTITF
jgi:hypothetical protein